MKLFLTILIASASLFIAPGIADAHEAILHDTESSVQDVEHVDRDVSKADRDIEHIDRDVKDGDKAISDADRETDSLFTDAEHDDGLLDDHPHDDVDEHEDDDLARDAEKAECDRLEFEYLLRHPPGTKPSGLRGLHGCALWRADARWHDEHPDVISVLGDNIFIGAKI
jgi:hypothetical protein